jgi:hypothetical protein
MNEIRWVLDKQSGTYTFNFIIGDQKIQVTVSEADGDQILAKAFKYRVQWNAAMAKLADEAAEHATTK